MSHLTEAMEKLGSNPALRSKVQVSCLSVLRHLGVNKELSLALMNNDRKKMRDITNMRENSCCYIIFPSSIRRELNHRVVPYHTKMNIVTRTMGCKVA